MHANDIRQRLLALLTAAVLLALCGCAPSGPQDSAQPAAAPSPSPSLPQPTTPEPDSDSASEDALVFLTYTSEEDAIRDAQIFSEKTGVDVVVAEGSDQAYELMLLDFAAGKHTYDLMLIDNALGSLYTSDDLIDRGVLQPAAGIGADRALRVQHVARPATVRNARRGHLRPLPFCQDQSDRV